MATVVCLMCDGCNTRTAHVLNAGNHGVMTLPRHRAAGRLGHEEERQGLLPGLREETSREEVGEAMSWGTSAAYRGRYFTHVWNPGVDVARLIGVQVLANPHSAAFRTLVGRKQDLFAPETPDVVTTAVVELMAGPFRSRRFIVPTRHPERMSAFLAAQKLTEGVSFARRVRNVWWGVWAEDAATADFRVPKLLGVDSDNLCVICEPLLGPISLKRFLWSGKDRINADPGLVRYINNRPSTRRVNWVVIAGDSKLPVSRPCDVSWIEALAADCEAAGTPHWIDRLGRVVTTGDGAYMERPPISDMFNSNLARRPEHLRTQQLPEGMPC